MERKQYLLIHKNEWDRLKRQTIPEPPVDHTKKEFLQALDEKSLEWQKSWPDAVQGTVLKVAKKKEWQRLRKIAFVKAYSYKQKKEKQHAADHIQRTRQFIFEGTGYGKQLIRLPNQLCKTKVCSAILESKTLEERDLQIKFQKEIKKKSLEIEMALEANQSFFCGSESAEKDQEQKRVNKEVAEVNRLMSEDHKQKIAAEKQQEMQMELEDARLMGLLLDYEATEKDHCEEIKREAVKEHEAGQQKIKERKLEDEKEEDKIADAWNKYQEKKCCKEKEMFDQMHKDKEETANYKTNYSNLEALQANQKQSYDDFIEKGVKKYDKRISDGEIADIEQKKQNHEKTLEVWRENQATAKMEHAIRCTHNSKCYCERQSLFTKSCGPPSHLNKATETPEEGDEEDKSMSFLKPGNKLMENLKIREKGQTPWTGLKGAHEQFAGQASNALAECRRYKHMARKVVNDYRKTNNLDSTTLPVSNYY